MPAVTAHRQDQAAVWFDSPAAQVLLAEAHAQAAALSQRVYGCWGLQLSPSADRARCLPEEPGRRLLRLHPGTGGFAGDLACEAGALPLADGSFSLIYLDHVLETAADPAGLLAELARLLEPEGVLIVAVLNPWSPARWHWRGRGLRAPALGRICGWLEDNDLEVERCLRLGRPRVRGRPLARVPSSRRAGVLAFWRPVNLIVARRRQPGMTPLPLRPALALRPEMWPG